MDDVVYVPPQDALLPFDSMGVRGCYGVILAGESADEEVMFGHLLPDLVDILVHIDGARVSEVAVIAVECELVLLPRFPLVGPYGPEPVRGILQAQSQSADPGEELDNPDRVFHVDPETIPIF